MFKISFHGYFTFILDFITGKYYFCISGIQNGFEKSIYIECFKKCIWQPGQEAGYGGHDWLLLSSRLECEIGNYMQVTGHRSPSLAQASLQSSLGPWCVKCSEGWCASQRAESWLCCIVTPWYNEEADQLPIEPLDSPVTSQIIISRAENRILYINPCLKHGPYKK